MYKTHGENLLNKFKSMEPIRTALGQIDNNDKTRGEENQKATTTGGTISRNDGTQKPTNASKSVKQVDNEVVSPMVTTEEVSSHSPNLSL